MTASSQTLASLLICSCSVLPLSDALSYTSASLFRSLSVVCHMPQLIRTIYAVQIGITSKSISLLCRACVRSSHVPTRQQRSSRMFTLLHRPFSQRLCRHWLSKLSRPHV